ncbi:MAG: hypothetical protein DMH00_11295, partial [Acidobacteria bacterium]
MRDSALSPSARRILSGCLFFSGAASLVMEVAWSRALSLILGNSYQAVATVVASMMTGLFLGGLLAARLLPRIRRLPLVYGRLEMGIGLYGALTPVIFKLLGLLLGPLYALPSGAFLFLRFLLVFVILLPPSAGMGATLPVATAALAAGFPAKQRQSGSVGGWLYGLNTLGGFVGTLAGGFLLLPGFGLLKSTLAGAGTSLAVGTLVWLLSDSILRQERAPAVAASKAAAPGMAWILPLYATSGFIAMVYEITWTRVLAPVAGSSVYSFTLILGAILAGIGAGSLLLSTRLGHWIHPGRGFAAAQILLGCVAFLSLWGLKIYPDLMLRAAMKYPSDPQAFLLREFLTIGAIVLPPGMLLGALFPFATRLLHTLEAEAGADVGRVYAWNTAGSLLGSLAAGFFLVETIGSQKTLGLACLASICVGFAGLLLAPGRIFRRVAGFTAVALAMTLPLFTPSWDLYRMTSGVTQLLRNIRQLGSSASVEQILAFSRTSTDVHILFHKEGKTSTVTVIREWFDRWLRVDGKTDASTTKEDMLTQVLLGQVPMFFARQPRDVCVIGYGSGVTAHAVLTHPISRLDIIEIERQVVEASPFFEDVNGRPLSDPRRRLVLDDARTALAYGPQQYDVIISEPSNPWMAGVNNLFTTEFYTLVRKRLRPGGIFCQWIQSYELSDESLKTLLDTLAASFPHVHLFASHLTADTIVLASDTPLSLVPGAAELFPDRPEVAKDLVRAGVTSLPDLAILYTSPLPPPLPGAVLNNDDNSLIQYRAPVEMLRGTEPQRAFIQASLQDLEPLFFPGVEENRVLLELGRACHRKGALATLTYLSGLLKEKGQSEAGAELLGLAEGLRAQLAREERVRASLTAGESKIAA